MTHTVTKGQWGAVGAWGKKKDIFYFIYFPNKQGFIFKQIIPQPLITSTTEGEGGYVFTPSVCVCYLQNRRFFKCNGSSILLFCLSLCLSPTGHNSKPIIMKLHQVVEVVSTEKPIDWGQRSSWGRSSKIVIFHPIDLKFEQDLHIASLNWESSYFWGQKVKGQLKVKLLKSSIFNWKIVSLHPINLKVEQHLHNSSLNWETNYFWGQKEKGQLKVKLLKSIFNWKIISLHPINLKVEQDLHIPSLNWESNYFWG